MFTTTKKIAELVYTQVVVVERERERVLMQFWGEKSRRKDS